MKWLADENFRNDILRGVARRLRAFDVVRAQDVEAIAGRSDVDLLQWATNADRVLLTHDVSTIVPAMREVVAARGSCAPIVVASSMLGASHVIDDIVLLDESAVARDWTAGLIYLPLR